MNLDRAERAALEHRDQVLNRGSVGPTPVIELADKIGYKVTEFKPDSRTSEISGAVNHKNQTIYINSSESAYRKRFTIAHEIGHIVLHGRDSDRVDYRKQIGFASGNEMAEIEANRFAAELLMPHDVFEVLWDLYEGNLQSMAHALQVSEEAILVRADSLGIS